MAVFLGGTFKQPVQDMSYVIFWIALSLNWKVSTRYCNTLGLKNAGSVNGLPLSLIVSWYEQKAVADLLALLSLGIRIFISVRHFQHS